MTTVVRTRREFTHLAEFERLIGGDRMRRLREAAAEIRDRVGDGTLWHVNSTTSGGGVAEMLHTLLPLYHSLGVRAGWLAIGGDDRFFALTKRLGTALYGTADGGGPLGTAQRDGYLRALAGQAREIASIAGPKDILLLHDHQTAGLARLLDRKVAATYWRCHVGVDESTPAAAAAWEFLTPLLDSTRGLVFSVPRHVPRHLRRRRVAILPPFISPFSLKNCALDRPTMTACLARCGLAATVPPATTTRVRTPSGPVALRHPVRVITSGAPRPGEPLLTQVSRWDRLKDMHGVLNSFGSGAGDGYLALVGPDPSAIPDDVEQNAWFDKCRSAWNALPSGRRRRVALICLPMADLHENAVLVNAIQRAADVVVQKSLAEGFGLTVTEAMWKSRIVVASAVGGIREQITHGQDGLLVDDPHDEAAFGALLAAAAGHASRGSPLGARAHRRVLRDYLPDREIVTTARLLGDDREDEGMER
ncbi:MAG TPA: glycosyltransferase [Actinophytocola sp.]|jgi:trehalose synthase|uniref:glycosyltransferase n=1 Tax=Actinophytocola sp. TaxID=1872138 RepID=UPI002DFC6C9B|nr:glycosyltransferase [Actinophytocola sp.]